MQLQKWISKSCMQGVYDSWEYEMLQLWEKSGLPEFLQFIKYSQIIWKNLQKQVDKENR